jgi:copper chaperone CopZ
MTIKRTGKLVFCLLFTLQVQIAMGQIRGAEIGINGLTCSQCSRSVEMQLRKLPFVANVAMNLEQTNGKISFKDNADIRLSALAKAVTDAGFSPRYLYVTLDVATISPTEGCFSLDQQAFYLLSPLREGHPATMTFQLIGKEFLPAKELKHYHLSSSGNCSGKEKYYLKAR